jgi:hypothetical protein
VRFKALIGAFLGLLLTSGPSSLSQLNSPHFPSAPSVGQQSQPQDEQRARMEKEMAKKANQERQADLKRDTDKLFRLATELKQSVDKSSENTLSLDVVKKAEEIEKLAHNVKDKMKGN